MNRCIAGLCAMSIITALVLIHEAHGEVRIRLPGTISSEVLPSIVAIRSEASQIFRDKPSAVIVPKRGIVVLQRFKAARAAKAGMGVIVSADGLIVTNAHTLSGIDTVSVVMFDGREFPGKVVWRLSDEDCAFISIKTSEKLKPIRFFDPNAVKGSRRVFAIVAKIAKNEIVMAALPGKITSVTKNVFWPEKKTAFPELVETDIHLYYGASGGPLITPQGYLIGIVEAGYIFGDRSFAISANRIKELVQAYVQMDKIKGVRKPRPISSK